MNDIPQHHHGKRVASLNHFRDLGDFYSWMTDNQTLAQEDKWKVSLLLSIYHIWGVFLSISQKTKNHFTRRGELFSRTLLLKNICLSQMEGFYLNISTSPLSLSTMASTPWCVQLPSPGGVLCLHKMLICSSNLPELHVHLMEIKGNYPAGCRTKRFYATINTQQFTGVWLQTNGHF